MLNNIIYNYKNKSTVTNMRSKPKLQIYPISKIAPRMNIEPIAPIIIHTQKIVEPLSNNIIQSTTPIVVEEKYTKFNKNIYIISNIQGGGSKKYLDDITNHYITVIMIINL